MEVTMAAGEGMAVEGMAATVAPVAAMSFGLARQRREKQEAHREE